MKRFYLQNIFATFYKKDYWGLVLIYAAFVILSVNVAITYFVQKNNYDKLLVKQSNLFADRVSSEIVGLENNLTIVALTQKLDHLLIQDNPNPYLEKQFIALFSKYESLLQSIEIINPTTKKTIVYHNGKVRCNPLTQNPQRVELYANSVLVNNTNNQYSLYIPIQDTDGNTIANVNAKLQLEPFVYKQLQNFNANGESWSILMDDQGRIAGLYFAQKPIMYDNVFKIKELSFVKQQIKNGQSKVVSLDFLTEKRISVRANIHAFKVLNKKMGVVFALSNKTILNEIKFNLMLVGILLLIAIIFTIKHKRHRSLINQQHPEPIPLEPSFDNYFPFIHHPGFILFDISTLKIVFLNDYAIELFGYKCDDLLDFIDEGIVKSLQNTEDTQTFFVDADTKNQKVAQLTIYKKQFQNQPFGVVECVVKFEKEQGENLESLYKIVYENSPASLILIDANTNKILKTNQKFLDLLGYATDEVLNLEYQAICTGNDSHADMASPIAECVLQTKNGANIDVLRLVATLNFDEQPYILASYIDISDKKSIINEINKAKEMADEAIRQKTFFISNLSHELRTPMNSIIGVSKMISKYNTQNLTDKQLDGLNVIYKSGMHLLDMINDLLDISSLETGRLNAQQNLISLDAVMYNLKDIAISFIKEKDIKFYIRKSQNVADKIISDDHKLTQILVNLLSNAVKFTESGRIILRIHNIENLLCFEMIDTGIGIDEDKLPVIFERYNQADVDGERVNNGSGLGLTLCKQLVQLIGGTIEIESKKNEGTIVRFQIPYLTESVEPVINNHNDEQEPEQSMRDKPLVLVIENDIQSQYLVSEYLKQNQFNVLSVNLGLSIVKKISSLNPDFILIDIGSNNPTGLEVLEQIKNHEIAGKIPVIITSSSNDIDDKYLYGYNQHITKPIRESELILKLKSIELERKGEECHVLFFDESKELVGLNKEMIKLKYNPIMFFELAFAYEMIEKIVPAVFVMNVATPECRDMDIIRFIKKHSNSEIKKIHIVVNTYKNIEEYSSLLKIKTNIDIIHNGENSASLILENIKHVLGE